MENKDGMKQFKKGPTRQLWVPFLVLGLSLSLTSAATYHLHITTEARDRLRFQNLVIKTKSAIQSRMEMYIAILRATAGLFDSSEHVTRKEFQSFIKRMDTPRNYPGIQGIGYSLRIKPEDKEAYTVTMRQEYGEAFHIRPEDERSEYHSITYLEPQDERNQAAIGYDMFTESTRHAAMERARDTGMPAMSGKVTLVQEIDLKKQAGFLIYVPVYRKGMPLTTEAERREALEGFPYSPFRADDLMQGILGVMKYPDIAFKIYAGTETKNESLLHDSDPSIDTEFQKPRFFATHQIKIAEFPWTIVYSTRQVFESGSAKNQTPFTFAIGILVSVILFGLALAQAKARARAEQLTEEVIEAERLKSQFLANVSHELRTPLTLTLAPIESFLAGDYGTFSEDQQRMIQTMYNNALRLLQMVTGLLDFSKLEAGKIEVNREPTPVVNLTKTILADFGSFAKQRALMIHESLPAESVVEMDRYLYERILFNLMSNAIKFTPNGGKVSVSLECSNGRLQLSVADTGTGIAESEIPHLFHRFRQVEGSSTRRFEGTGLGLALVKEFSQLLGGEVAVESSVGKGSRFTVDLAAPPSTARAKDVETKRSETKMLQKDLPTSRWVKETTVGESQSSGWLPKVLIAEDNVELAAYILSLLKDTCQVRIAQDGEEALAIVPQWLPDAVISDVMMPKRDGLSLCREIKSNPKTTKIPVVLLTALTHREALLKGWEAGADEYLFKPFHPKELVTRIKSILSNTRMAKEVEELAIQAQKMAAVGQLAGGVAHEINNPLAVILGFAQGLAKRLKPGDPNEEPIRSIEEEAKRCKSLVQDLLIFSRAGKTENEELDIKQTIERALSLVLAQSRVKDVEVVTEFSATPKILANKNQIQQVIINLAINAIDAMPKGGKLTLRTKKVNAQGKDYLEIGVEDTGHGIPPEIQSRIFEPFFTTKEVGKGTGLGLALVYDIIRKHEGEITVESDVDRGTVFHITLPFAEVSKINSSEKIPS